MKLIEMVDFVLEQKQNLEIGKDFIKVVCNYANFLNQPRKLEMFVPCDDERNVLDRPLFDEKNLPYGIKYDKAKEKVLFEGFEYRKELRNSGGNYTHFITNNKIEIYIKWGGFYVFCKTENKIENIEDLIKYDLTLTKSAIKKLGL
jgi:hypothetical protein